MLFYKLILFSCILLQLSLGDLDSGDKTILEDWYNSLDSQNLNWDFENLCYEGEIQCDGSEPQRIIKLEFNYGLPGTIPTEFVGLTSLQGLYISSSDVSVTIPTELGSFTSLQELSIQGSISGTVPTELGELRNLTTLQLMCNISGTIPVELWNLTSLETLMLYTTPTGDSTPVGLSGTIPAGISNLINVQYLVILSQCSGTIPTEIGNMTNLTALGLASENLSGTIPTEIGNLKSLMLMAFVSNELSGTIPTEIGRLTNLTLAQISAFWSITRSGLPSKTHILGTIPTELENLTLLSSLDLGVNKLSGTIPTFFFTMPSLKDLNLAYNDWDCPILDYSPASFSNGQYVSTDYSDASGFCDFVCPEDRCLSGQTCSGRLNDDLTFLYSCCEPGYIGEYCDIAVTCPAIPNEENAEWDETIANGEIVLGKCLQIGYDGPISRVCVQDGINGTTGNWSTIFGSCEAGDACLLTYGGCHEDAYCLYASENFNCTCKDGYEGDGFNCTDIDECLINNGECDINANCVNTIGSRNCTCHDGFSGNGTNCLDVNECTLNTDNCHAQATCRNSPGSFNCTCNLGYSGNGTFCEDTDECLTNQGGCHADAICTNTIGSFTCTCKPEYSGTGFLCNDIDECLINRGGCHDDANCKNTKGSFLCTCKTGYSGDGFSCEDLNECESNNGGCDVNSDCTNTIGSRECKCKTGYSGDGITCNLGATSENQSNQAIGIGIGVTVGILALILLVLLILFFIRRNKQKQSKTQQEKISKYLQEIDLERTDTEELSMTQLANITLMNTKLEVSMPGFMKIDYVNQIRKGEKIGGGGCAIIYKGVILDQKLRERFGCEEVALKEIYEDQNYSKEEDQIRFEQEISIMWGVSSHPNIITLVGYSETPRCIITKLYDQDLSEYIRGHSTNIPSDIILKLTSDIAAGMNMVNEFGIVHRDLKPSNILLEKENGKLNAIICDFGLARVKETKVQTQKIIDIKGFSPRYTAPEVFGKVTTSIANVSIEYEMKGDVYSFALIIWEMMSRKAPWAHLKEVSEIEHQVRSEKREAIPESNGDQTLEFLTSLIEVCWKQNANDRPTFKQIDQKLSPLKNL